VTIASRSFAPERASPGETRHWVAELLQEWDVPDELQDSIQLLVAELCANAVEHGRSAYLVVVKRTADAVRIAITDENPEMPAPTKPPDDVDSGRGLEIVSALAERWGVQSIPDDGKVVWFQVCV
jgi:anti-sigma regulatory factor (Ser/Thr protein kinase)